MFGAGSDFRVGGGLGGGAGVQFLFFKVFLFFASAGGIFVSAGG